MLFLRKESNADAAAINLLKQLKVNINKQDIIDELEKHPDYPSLLAISDVLNWFKINNAAYRINAEELIRVPVPFIANTNQNDDFVSISKIVDDKVYLSDDKRGNYSLTLDEFKKRFMGVVLTAETPIDRIQSNAQSLIDKLAPYKVPTTITGLGMSLIIYLVYLSPTFSNVSWQFLTLTFFKTTGLITSILLLIQSIDKNNPLVQTLCGGSSKTDCNTILTSTSATVFKGLSWSEVGFFYFASTWLMLLFGGSSTGILQAIALLNAVSLPYTIYSINYQARVAKKWCVLCTTVQALLWLEFISLVRYLKTPFYISGTIVPEILICVVLPVAVWILLKPLLLKNQQLITLKQSTRKLKYNRDLFEISLKEQPKYTLPDEGWSIVLGNIEANTIITMVSNPYCQPCSEIHQELEEWLNRLDDIQLRIVFTASNNKKDRKTQVCRHLMALSVQNDKAKIREALHDWYGQKQKNYEEWAKQYPVSQDETQYHKIDKQRAWCDLSEIKVTPTLLINGYHLPEAYLLHDIKYMLN
jgi:uncharacterized membrane protein